MATKGNCYLCGAELGKVAMLNHILKCHAGTAQGQECRLLKIEGADNKDYWLYVDIPTDNTLEALDSFLRKIWLECCGHLSEFAGASKSAKLERFHEGDKFLHEYDFGDTTQTRITVAGTLWRPKQREVVRLLARNVPPHFTCAECGAPAVYICTECAWETEEAFYCEHCAQAHEHDAMLPVTNSPRMGVCAYCGEQDVYEFASQPKNKM